VPGESVTVLVALSVAEPETTAKVTVTPGTGTPAHSRTLRLDDRVIDIAAGLTGGLPYQLWAAGFYLCREREGRLSPVQ
jgi:hypothetical protein